MKIRRFIAALVLTFFTFCALGVHAAEAHTHCVCGTFSCTADSETKHADQKINEADWQPWSGDLSVGTVTDETTEIYLYLENDVTIKDTLNITNVTVHLCLNGKTLTIDKEGNPAVRVGENQKFVLCDCKGNGKITGAKGNAGDAATLRGTVNCRVGSNFIMYGGSIADNELTGSNGGGVFVNGGTFAMYGGSLKNNKAQGRSGGAVSIENGKIYVYGGEMSGNSAVNGGAIHLAGKTEAKITNIKLNNNTVTSMGGAIFTETNAGMEIRNVEMAGNSAKNGGGIYVKGYRDNTTYPYFYTNIYDCDIHNNTATGDGGGMCLDGANWDNQFINLYDCKVRDNSSDASGGGIFVKAYANVNMYGGLVTGNKAPNGGGIRLHTYAYFMVPNHNSTLCIKGNSAGTGGGISSNANWFTISGGCVIEENTAENSGGGVYIGRTGSWLIFTNTTVTKNKAPLGGGIMLDKNNTGSELEIAANTSVIGNTSSEDGSASNLYLNNGRMFQFRKGITGNEKVAVSVSNIPTADAATSIEYEFTDQYHADGDHKNLIIPDKDDYVVLYEKDMHYLALKAGTVTFDSNGGSMIESVDVAAGRTVPEPNPAPTRRGHTFDGWYLSDGTAYDFETVVTGDITLIAKWMKDKAPTITLTAEEVSVSDLNQTAMLYVASYKGNSFVDIKKIQLDADKALPLSSFNLNTEGATRISAFLWGDADGTWEAFLLPLCRNKTIAL